MTPGIGRVRLGSPFEPRGIRRAADLPVGACPFAGDAVIVLDAGARVTRWNRAAETLLGLPAGAATGVRLTDLARYRQVVTADVHAAILSPSLEGTWRGEYAPAGPAGEARILEFSVSRLAACEAGPCGTLLLIRDVTAVRPAEGATPPEPSRGFVPICAHCKSVGDGQGHWHPIEVYLAEHSGATLRQEMCPVCLRMLYPELCEEGPSPSAAMDAAA